MPRRQNRVESAFTETSRDGEQEVSIALCEQPTPDSPHEYAERYLQLEESVPTGHVIPMLHVAQRATPVVDKAFRVH